LTNPSSPCGSCYRKVPQELHKMKPQMNKDEHSSVLLLTCESLPGGQGYFHREDAKSAKKSDFKNFAFFASSRWIFWFAAGLHCVYPCSSVVSLIVLVAARPGSLSESQIS